MIPDSNQGTAASPGSVELSDADVLLNRYDQLVKRCREFSHYLENYPKDLRNNGWSKQPSWEDIHQTISGWKRGLEESEAELSGLRKQILEVMNAAGKEAHLARLGMVSDGFGEAFDEALFWDVTHPELSEDFLSDLSKPDTGDDQPGITLI